MIELLLSIQVTILTGLLLSLIIPYLKPTSNYQSFQVYQFMASVEKEVQSSQSYLIQDNTITLTTLTGDVVTIKQYQKVIRRQVNGRGHEILLRDVNNFKVHQMNSRHPITLSISTINEEIFNDDIILYSS